VRSNAGLIESEQHGFGFDSGHVEAHKVGEATCRRSIAEGSDPVDGAGALQKPLRLFESARRLGFNVNRRAGGGESDRGGHVLHARSSGPFLIAAQ